MKFVALVVVLFALAPAHAQQFPVKPIRVIVPYPPGPIDVHVRLIAPTMQQELGQPIVPDNRPGASGAIGMEATARAAPDGHTLMAVAAGSLLVSPLITGNAPFKPLEDFTPITMIYNAPVATVVRSTLPVSTLKELIDHARKNPGKLSYGSAGMGSSPHLEGQMLASAAGLNMLHVPYKGFPLIFQGILSQEVDLTLVSIGTIRNLVFAGKMKLLAVHNGRVSPGLPQVPDLVQAVPGFIPVPNWVGVLGPAGLAAPVLARLNGAAVKALRTPEVTGRIEEGGAAVGADTPQEFAAVIRANHESSVRAVKVLRDAGVKFE